jgi:methyltransferase (TIGR00027 family)
VSEPDRTPSRTAQGVAFLRAAHQLLDAPPLVLEVDQPASQALKREQLAAAGVATQPNVSFASIDFERESMRDGLRRHGVSFAEATFFSWLGVTVYLTEPAVDAVLETVVEFPAGSEIVFTFSQPRASDARGSPESEMQPTLADLAAKVGEPWHSYFEVDALERRLRSIGFRTVEFLTPAESQRLYFTARSDGLSAPKRTSIVSALV